MREEGEIAMQVLMVVGAILGVLLLIIGPLMWTVHRVLRPVDRAARDRNLPFRFSMGDFLCLFWIVQLPLAFVYQIGGDRDGDGDALGDAEVEQFYWILTAAVWVVAPLAWFTVARALSKAGVSAGLHRMIFLGIVLPTVYYGLFPFIGISVAMTIGIGGKGLAFFLEKKFMTSMWCVLLVGLIACGFYSPWMIRRGSISEMDETDETGS